MAPASKNHRENLWDGALESVREAFAETDDEDLIEQRPADDAPEKLQPPLHNPWWAGE